MINTQFISAAVKEGGVGRFSATELNKFLAGKTVRINAGVGDETQSISGNSSIKDIRTLFELTYLYFTNLRRDEFDKIMRRGGMKTGSPVPKRTATNIIASPRTCSS